MQSQIQVHADERTQVYSARSSLVVIHPSTNRGRRALTLVKKLNARAAEPALDARSLKLSNVEPG